MKKFLALVVALAMMTCIMGGCGLKSDNNTTDGSSGNNTANGGGEEAPYEIVVELIGSGVAQTDTSLVEAEINKITLPKINCTVKFREITIADHATQLSLLGSDGDRMDIVFVGYTTSMANLNANGLLVNIKDYLNEYGKEMMAIAGSLMDACYIGDGIYCVPGDYYPAVQTAVTYDKEYAAEYGVAIPENADNSFEFLDSFFASVKDSGFPQYCASQGDGTSVMLPGYTSETFGTTMGSAGSYGVLLDATEDTTIVNKFALPEYRESCHKMREWYEKGYLVPDSLTSGSTLFADMIAGKIFGSIANVNATYALNNVKFTGRELGAVEFHDYTITGTSIPEYGLGVTITSEHPEKAVQLLNLIFTNDDLANLMNYGIEGKHYEKISEHIIKDPDGVDYSNKAYGLQIVTFGNTGTIYRQAPFTEDWYEDVKAFSPSNAKFSKAFGYVFDPSSVKTQVAAVNAVIGEYQPTLACGMIEESKIDARLDEFISALENAGINDVIAENQHQFDAWLAAKK